MPVKILDKITVVECATFVTGPYATALLADLGARVIKIELPPEGDPYRYFAPDPFFSFNFAHLNRNKESLVLDLKTPEGESYPAGTPPLLILHGGVDASITMEDVAALSRELEAAKLPYEIQVYSGAPHAFTVFGTDAYRQDADEKSWAAFTQFLVAQLAN